jgi:hypothetical protein
MVAAGFIVLALAACDSGIPGSERERTIPRDVFIRAMVELRLAAAESPGDPMTSAGRDQLLEEMGVTPDQLVRFAEVHGRNVPYMNDIWQEVNRRLQERADQEEDFAPPLPVRPPVSESGS